MNKNHQKILIALSMPIYNDGNFIDQILYNSFKEKGCDVKIIVCDMLIPVCQMIKIENHSVSDFLKGNTPNRCDECYFESKNLTNTYKRDILYFSNYISSSDINELTKISVDTPYEEIRKYSILNIPIGDHAYAGTLRYFARGDLIPNKESEVVLRKFFLSALISHKVTINVQKKYNFDKLIAHHGIYVPQGIILNTFKHLNVPVYSWTPSYRKYTFIFSKNDTYHYTMLSENPRSWKNIVLTKKIKSTLFNYLNDRMKNSSRDWIWFHDKPLNDIALIKKKIGIKNTFPIVSLLTSVVWDAQLHYKSNAFNSMLEWIFFTIEFFSYKENINLVIRIHPAEIRGAVPSNQHIFDEIQKKYFQLPKNIFIIKPESQVSTYELCKNSNATIIYNTKTGIELSALGLQVIVAGEAWIRNKGFTIDVSSINNYEKILRKIPLKSKLSKVKTNLAIKYAFHFFFRRMIEFKFMKFYEKNNIKNLISQDIYRNDKNLDFVVNQIISSKTVVNKIESKLININNL